MIHRWFSILIHNKAAIKSFYGAQALLHDPQACQELVAALAPLVRCPFSLSLDYEHVESAKR